MASRYTPPLLPYVTPYTISRFVETLPSDMKRGVRTLTVSFALITHFLGEDWTKENVVAIEKGRIVKRGFFALDVSDTSTSESRERGAHRAYHLAELLLNLQIIDGFEDRVADLLTGDSKKMEATFAELQVAAILLQHRLFFRFVPKGIGKVRGESYDFDVFKDGGVQIRVEAKCKLESTDVRADSILTSLHAARKQVPKDEPAAIFVKIPQSWVEAGKLVRLDLEAIAYDFLRQTTRVISVVFYTPFVTVSHGRLGERHICHEVENVNSRFRMIAPCLIRDFESRSIPYSMSSAWTRLMPLIEGNY